MDVWEKLVEIIQNSVGGCARHWAEIIADGLIAHGVTVQSEIDANTLQLMRECERLKEEKESLANAVNVLEEINSDLCKQIKGVTVQKWIPVTERLPKEKGFYLTARKRDIFVEQWNGVWFSERCHHAQPTHWMPLPEAPKGE